MAGDRQCHRSASAPTSPLQQAQHTHTTQKMFLLPQVSGERLEERFQLDSPFPSASPVLPVYIWLGTEPLRGNVSTDCWSAGLSPDTALGAPKSVRKALWPSGALGVCWQGAVPPVRDVFSPGIGLTCSQHPASFGLLPPPSAPDQSKLPRAYGGTAAEIL